MHFSLKNPGPIRSSKDLIIKGKMKIVNQETDVSVNSTGSPVQQESLDDTEDFENSINPLDMLEVSPVDTVCSPVSEDVNIVVFEKSPFRCPECFVAFPAYASYRYHVIVRHGKDPVVLCDTCGVPCSSTESQAAHKNEAHVDKPPEENVKTKRGSKKAVNKLNKNDKIIALRQGNQVLILEKLSTVSENDLNANTPEENTADISKGTKKRKSRKGKREINNEEEYSSDSDFSPDNKELRYSESVAPRSYNLRQRRATKKRKTVPEPEPDLDEEESDPSLDEEESEPDLDEEETAPDLDKEETAPDLDEEETEPAETTVLVSKQRGRKKRKSEPEAEVDEEEMTPGSGETVVLVSKRRGTKKRESEPELNEEEIIKPGPGETVVLVSKRRGRKKRKSEPEPELDEEESELVESNIDDEETDPMETEEESKIEEAEGVIKCPDCDSTFHSEGSLEDHRIGKHGYNPYKKSKIKAKCEGCGKEFGSLSVYRRHGPEKCTLKSEPEEKKTKQNGRKS